MPRNLKIAGIKWKGGSVKDPRVGLRLAIAVLLAANLAAAVMAFKPFGGSAEDMRNQQASLSVRLTSLEQRIGAAKRLAGNVETARREGDEFLAKYIFERRTLSSALGEELNRMAKEAGIRALPAQIAVEPIEGSETLSMATIVAGYEGTYANLKKFVELVDKSPRFLIIENMNVVSPQQQQSGQVVNVSLKLDAFIQDKPGASL